MEIKAVLNKPYTKDDRMNFIITQNHEKGYEIRETSVALEAWGLTDIEILDLKKQEKYNEALMGAEEFIVKGNALYEFEEGKHIEATDGNIAKFSTYESRYNSGMLPAEYLVPWNTKEDETVELTKEQVSDILTGMGMIQAGVWTVKFPYYVAQINAAETIADVEAIVIDYTMEFPEEEQVEE